MSILITNDDGIEAPGLESLRQVATQFADVIVVAPDRQHSGCGHRISEGEPIPVESQSDFRYAIGGTPADCARIALSHLAPETQWVFSGINSGGNLGCDVFMSGTVAAVREAALMGTRGIAISQYRDGMNSPIDWSRSARWTKAIIERLLTEPLLPGEFWNVNLPDVEIDEAHPDIIFCPVDVQHYQFECEVQAEGLVYRSNYQQRPRTPGRDIDVCFSGNISVTKLTVCSNAPGMNQ